MQEFAPMKTGPAPGKAPLTAGVTRRIVPRTRIPPEIVKKLPGRMMKER